MIFVTLRRTPDVRAERHEASFENIARPHTARVTQAYLNDMNITVMECPAKLPGWDLLKRKVRSSEFQLLLTWVNCESLKLRNGGDYPRRPSITSFSVCLDG
ncbi:jg2990 [Pararge aegeria aegeria]|uniref:Jg2990 protein n=1 Tax=Pararge aegeria aegeria TaxID=348720 RepID=A0A8S4SGM2_9NEOP|nr:jg2990 [Pararge aegeria aegeria]